MKKILIIEDDLSIAEVEKDYLELHDFEIDISVNGKEGLKRALEIPYDLIVLDLMLPDINGFEICKRIREDKEVPIIIVSARSDDIDKIRGLGLGSDDYMTKPFSPNELVARVKAHLKRYDRLLKKDDINNDIIQIKGLEINNKTRIVLVDGKSVELTVKEYEILLLLASNPNVVFSKEKIFLKIWGYDTDKDEPTITVHVRKLREKIEKNPSEPEYIKTVWGVGYKLEK